MRRSRAEELADSLLHDILMGAHPAQSALPSEAELAERSGVSRLTVREAVKRLQAKGVLRVEHGRGTFVMPVSTWSVLDPALLMARSAYDADPLLLPLKFIEARRLVEVGVAELAASRRSDDDLEQLRVALKEMRRAAREKDVPAFVRADIAFHQQVLDAADNAFVAALFDPLSQILQLTRHQTSAHGPVRTHAIAHHKNILDALVAGDPVASRNAMHAHIVQTERDMLRYVREPARALGDAAGHPRAGR